MKRFYTKLIFLGLFLCPLTLIAVWLGSVALNDARAQRELEEVSATARSADYANVAARLDAILNQQEEIMRIHAGEKVLVSWYGSREHGKTMACGTPYDMNSNTVAHKSLPFGTVVVLRREDTGAAALGVVRDRGPFIDGRTVDVSYRIARELGMVRQGLVEVRMYVVWRPLKDIVIPKMPEK